MLAKGSFTVSQDPADSDRVVLKKNNVVVGNKFIRISSIRAYLVGTGTAQYTLNAAIRIARFVSDELGLQYQVPTNLSGTSADDKLIIPDIIALGVVLLQAHNAITVDGIPGADFIRRVMGLHQNIQFPAHCRAAFMEESNNSTIVTPTGALIVQPDKNANEAQVYDFLRSITIARNGLWSDRPNIVSLTGMRFEHGNTHIQWDDAISACWVSADGVKHAKVYTATTEPGNRLIFKTMLPQTVIFVPGYHQGKLPGLRGHRTVASDPNLKFPDRYLFNTNDERGLNLHPGGSTGSMKKLVKYILPGAANNEAEFKPCLVFMEIFEILSRWGLDPKRPALENLAGWAAAKALRTGNISNGLIPVFQDEKTQAVKQISVASARGWIAQKWTADRATLLKILRFVEPAFMPPTNFNTLITNGLALLISDKHLLGIVKKQCDFFFDLKDVDGLAGNTFLSIINAELPADGALAQKANSDFARMNTLLSQFGAANTVLNTKRKDYVKQIITQTLVERAKLKEAAEKAALGEAVNEVGEAVNNWSILCQVVFGPEMFYEMMHHALGRALETGQRRWYYTLIDSGTIPI